MADEFTVKAEDIVMEGQTFPPYGNYMFTVYRDGDSFRVNTDNYIAADGSLICNSHYDRRLCGSVEELRNMTFHQIEGQAYGAYMDGAR